MEDNKKECLEERTRTFLNSAAIGRISFSKAFEDQPEEMRELLISKGYVVKSLDPNIQYSITGLGRTYAASC